MRNSFRSHLLVVSAFCVFVASLATGCGPLHAATAISDGTVILEQAERSGAEKYARYHFTKARLLLAEAKKRNGYGQYEVARQWASEARDLAAEANRKARARQELDRRRTRMKPKTAPIAPKTPKTKPKTKPDPKTPGTTPKPPSEKRKPLLPPPTRTKILPPSMGGGS
jgi:hypothetical protein